MFRGGHERTPYACTLLGGVDNQADNVDDVTRLKDKPPLCHYPAKQGGWVSRCNSNEVVWSQQ